MGLKKIKVGASIKILEGKEEIARATICSIDTNIIEVECNGGKTEFGLVNHQKGKWKMLFSGLGGELCFNENAPEYTFALP